MADATVAVVICAYTMERLDDIERAVGSVSNQHHRADELILVIDHNPELAEEARKRFSTARVIDNTATRGLSGGRNTGIASASSDIVAFLDDDAQADPDWLERMLPWYTEPTVIGVGGTSEPVWRSGRPAWFPVEFDWVVGCSYRGRSIFPGGIGSPVFSSGRQRSRTALAGGPTSVFRSRRHWLLGTGMVAPGRNPASPTRDMRRARRR